MSNIRETLFEQRLVYCTKDKLNAHAKDLTPGCIYYTTDTKQLFCDIAYDDGYKGHSTAGTANTKRVCFDSLMCFNTYADLVAYTTNDLSSEKLYYVRGTSTNYSEAGIYHYSDGKLNLVIKNSSNQNSPALYQLVTALNTADAKEANINKVFLLHDTTNPFETAPYTAHLVVKNDNGTYGYVRLVPTRDEIEDHINSSITDSLTQLNEVLDTIQLELEARVNDSDGGFKDTGISKVIQGYMKKGTAYLKKETDTLLEAQKESLLHLIEDCSNISTLRKDVVDTEVYPGGVTDTDPAVITLEDTVSVYTYDLDTSTENPDRHVISFDTSKLSKALEVGKAITFELILHNTNNIEPMFNANISWVNNYEPEYVFEYTSIIFRSIDRGNTWIAAFNGGWLGGGSLDGDHSETIVTPSEAMSPLAAIEEAKREAINTIKEVVVISESTIDSQMSMAEGKFNVMSERLDKMELDLENSVGEYIDGRKIELVQAVEAAGDLKLSELDDDIANIAKECEDAVKTANDASAKADSFESYKEKVDNIINNNLPTYALTDLSNCAVPYIQQAKGSASSGYAVKYSNKLCEQFGQTEAIYCGGAFTSKPLEVKLPMNYSTPVYNIQVTPRILDLNATKEFKIGCTVIKQEEGSFTIWVEPIEKVNDSFQVQFYWTTKGLST